MREGFFADNGGIYVTRCPYARIIASVLSLHAQWICVRQIIPHYSETEKWAICFLASFYGFYLYKNSSDLRRI